VLGPWAYRVLDLNRVLDINFTTCLTSQDPTTEFLTMKMDCDFGVSSSLAHRRSSSIHVYYMPGSELRVASKRILQRQLENLVVPSKANVTFLMDPDDCNLNDLHCH
jgi:hypothetical protein